MKKQQNNDIRFLKGAKILFYVVPLLFIGYLYMTSLYNDTHFLTPVLEDPYITVLFIVAMLNPFCGVIVGQFIEQLEKRSIQEISFLHMYILMIAQGIVGNLFGFMALALGLYKQRAFRLEIVRTTVANFRQYGQLRIVMSSTAILCVSVLCSWMLLQLTA